MSNDNDSKLMSGLNRRRMLAGLGAGVGLGIAGAASAGPAHGRLDLEDPALRLAAFIKLRADLSGAPVYSGATGEIWGWVPGEDNVRLFRTWTLGITRASRTASAWQLEHQELTWYQDPDTGELLAAWANPISGELVQVQAQLTRAPTRLLQADAELPAYELRGDELVFVSNEFAIDDAPRPRAAYLRQGLQERLQAGELRTFVGRLSEVSDPALSSAPCVTACSRISQWLPFMAMGNRPGVLIHQVQLQKLANGLDDVPAVLIGQLHQHYPELLQRPAIAAADPAALLAGRQAGSLSA